MKKGEIYEGVITKFDFPNKGNLVMEDRKVVVKGTLPGQKIRFMITKKKSGMADGKLLKVLEPAPMEDMQPLCPYFGECGGCTYQTMSYKNQLAFKEGMVKQILDRVLLAGGSNSSDYVWEGILASPETEGYRNKMEFTFGDAYKGGPLALGLHKKGSFHDILTVSGCRIIGADWTKLLDYTVTFFAEKNVPYFHRMSHEGILRNLVIRQSKANGQFLINMVASSQWEKYGFASIPSTVEEGQKVPEILVQYADGLCALANQDDFEGTIAGILYTENDTLGDVVQCDRLVRLYGTDFIVEEVMGLSFRVSPFSFFQTNTKGCEVLYTKAREYIMSGSVMKDAEAASSSAGMKDVEAAPSSAGMKDVEAATSPAVMKDVEAASSSAGKVVFDLYSGTGTIAQMMAPAAGKVIGIEIVEEAVEAAKENAKLNGLANCDFIAGDVLKAIDLVEDTPDVIIVDPPRDGIHPKALEKILDFGVDQIVYISCKPTSLARDLEYIINHGYHVDKACCVDQFPGTVHVESITLLQKI